MYKIIAISLFLVLLLPSTVSAHVLVQDESKTSGALLHIVPDDDPVAGEEANLFFDLQEQIGDTKSVALTITNADGDAAQVPVEISDKSIKANYTFPSRGVYELSLTVGTQTFHHTQRILRGESGTSVSNETHAGAQLALVMSVVSFMVLLIIGFNHRREIKRHSTF